jgi:hypothetical protein
LSALVAVTDAGTLPFLAVFKIHNALNVAFVPLPEENFNVGDVVPCFCRLNRALSGRSA